MYPRLENSNPEALDRIKAIAANAPEFLPYLAVQFAEAMKYNVLALFPHEIEQLISDFRHVQFPPLASLALDELANTLAEHITDKDVADQISQLETSEAMLLVVALQLYYADERANPGRPFAPKTYAALKAYMPFFPVLGFDQK
jgi:hypothetical protein